MICFTIGFNSNHPTRNNTDLITWMSDIQEAFLLGVLSTALISTVVIVVIWQRLRRQFSDGQQRWQQSQYQVETLQGQLHDRHEQHRQLHQQSLQQQQLLSDTKAECAGLQAQLQQVPVLQKQVHEKEQQVQALYRETREQARRLADLSARAESEAGHHADQIKLLNDSKEQLKSEFSQLANEIFEQKQQRFSEQSKASINALLDPFNRQIEQFRKRVDDIHTKDAEGRSQLLTQLSMLKDMNTQLNKQADDLTKALKGDKKLQGNWGELQIERILESSGLQKGREFEREPNYKDDQGNNRRPDFIIHLPDGKHIIVDSKVSLNAYQQAVAADDELTREPAVKEHVAAVRSHIRALSDKNYPGLTGLNSPDFVLMFMPVESAFITAFEADQNLFNDAFERHIVVVTPTTLLATLRTVANLWVLERQNENAKELYSLAGKIYDKVAVFSHKMERLGTQISTTEKTYHDALNSLTVGRGSMLSYVERLKDIGAPTSKQIAESMQTGQSLPETEDSDTD